MVYKSVYSRTMKFLSKFKQWIKEWRKLREVVLVTTVMPFKYEFRHLDEQKKQNIIDFISKWFLLFCVSIFYFQKLLEIRISKTLLIYR